MPDLNPLSPNRSRDRDPNDVSHDANDAAAGLAASTAKADTKKAAHAKAPAKTASHDSLPEHAPSTKTMDKRAFTNPALAGSPKPPEQPITVRDLCVAASKLGAKGPDGQISAEVLASCVKSNGACMSPEDAMKVANACTSLAQMDESAAEKAAAAKNPMLIPTPRGTFTEAQMHQAMAEQLLTEDSVRSNPLAAVSYAVSYETGATRHDAYLATEVANHVTNTVQAAPVAGGMTNAAAAGHIEDHHQQESAEHAPVRTR